MAPGSSDGLRLAFVIRAFPVGSEMHMFDQVTRLLDRGVDVRVFAFERGDETESSPKFADYGLAPRVTYVECPRGWRRRFARAWPKALRLARRQPLVLLRALNVLRYGRQALSLRLLYAADAVAGAEVDVVHCHFGPTAVEFVAVREVAGLDAPLVTSFYGSNVSRVFRNHGRHYYERLKQACSLYFVTSQDMQRRVVANGFPAERVRVLPEGADLHHSPFRLRALERNEELKIVALGHFIEKMGFDDLIRALAIVKREATRPVSCLLVGAGPLEGDLRRLCAALGVDDIVRFVSFLPADETMALVVDAHLLVQPSKIAADGDMD